MVHIKCSDGSDLSVPREHLLVSGTLSNMLAGLDLCLEVPLTKWCSDATEDTSVPLDFNNSTLSKVFQYCAHQFLKSAAAEDNEASSFDTDFVKDLDAETIVELIRAANFLDIRKLLDLLCRTLAETLVGMFFSCLPREKSNSWVSGKSPESIYQYFGVSPEVTPEDIETLKREYPWAIEES